MRDWENFYTSADFPFPYLEGFIKVANAILREELANAPLVQKIERFDYSWLEFQGAHGPKNVTLATFEGRFVNVKEVKK